MTSKESDTSSGCAAAMVVVFLLIVHPLAWVGWFVLAMVYRFAVGADQSNEG